MLAKLIIDTDGFGAVGRKFTWFFGLATCVASVAQAMTDETTPYLTIDELSRRSGLSASTLHRLKNAGKILFFQPAGKRGRLLFPADAIEQSARPVPPHDEGAAAADSPKRLSGRQPIWMRPPSPKNHE